MDLGELGVFQRLLRTGEQGGRVGHRGVKPGGIELVTEVVMLDDVALRPLAGVRPQLVQHGVDHAHPRAAGEQIFPLRFVGRGQCHDRTEIRRFPLAIDIGFGEADVAAHHQPANGQAILQHHGGLGAFMRGDGAVNAAVRQHHGEPAAADHRGELEGQAQPAIARRGGEQIVDRKVGAAHAGAPKSNSSGGGGAGW